MIVYVRQRRKNYQQQSKNFHCVHRASRSLQHSIDHLLPEWWLHLSADNLLLSSDAVSYGPSQLLGVLTFHSVKRYFHLHSWLCSFLLVSFLIWTLESPQKHHERNFCMPSADAAAHYTRPDCLPPSAMETPTYTWLVSRLSSSRFSHNALFSRQASGYRQNGRSQMSLRIIPSVLYSDKSQNGTRCSLFPSPCVSMYWRMTSIRAPPALSRCWRMCYLVAKRFDKIGSVALRTCHGKN